MFIAAFILACWNLSDGDVLMDSEDDDAIFDNLLSEDEDWDDMEDGSDDDFAIEDLDIMGRRR